MGTVQRALGYVRVSKAREEMISPELQTNAIIEWCSRNKVTLIDTITDLDATGRNFAREGVQQVIARVEAKEADVVVVWKWSRFGRNVRDCLINIDRVEIAGGRLVAATEEFDDSPVGRFGRGQFLLMAQFESERIGEQWKEAQARRLRNGLPFNGRPRWGYKYDRETGYTIDEEVSPYVAESYDRYLRGDSPLQIARWLNSHGVPTPGGNSRWMDHSVRQALATGFAAGLIRYGMSKGPRRDRGAEQFAPGRHEPIISMTTWEKYRRKRGALAAAPSRLRHPSSPYSGLLYCGTCGERMQRNNEDGWVCRTARRMEHCKKPAYTSPPTVDPAIRKWLETVAQDVDTAAEIAAKTTTTRKQAGSQSKALTRELGKLETALTRLTRSYAEGAIPIEAYIVTRDELMGEIEMKRQVLAQSLENVDTMAKQPGRVAPTLLAEWDNIDNQGRRDILRSLVSQIIVTPRGRGYRPIIEVRTRWGDVWTTNDI